MFKNDKHLQDSLTRCKSCFVHAGELIELVYFNFFLETDYQFIVSLLNEKKNNGFQKVCQLFVEATQELYEMSISEQYETEKLIAQYNKTKKMLNLFKTYSEYENVTIDDVKNLLSQNNRQIKGWTTL